MKSRNSAATAAEIVTMASLLLIAPLISQSLNQAGPPSTM
jgi:hypothetical protein